MSSKPERDGSSPESKASAPHALQCRAECWWL